MESPSVWLLLAGPIIWSVYHVLAYFIVEAACRRGILMGETLGINTLILIIVILTLAALAGILYAAYISYQWAGTLTGRPQRAEASRGETQPGREDRRRFIGMVSSWFNFVLVLGVLVDVLPLLVIGPCG
jgi:hypothetical protein